MPGFLLHEWRKRKFNPRLVEMGITPTPARGPVEFLGSTYGGHAIDLASLNKDSVFYCLGAGLDISFEEEVAKRTGCHVDIFDPTPRSVTWLQERLKSQSNPNPIGAQFTIHPIGIWSGDSSLKFYAPQNPEDVSYSLTNLQGTEEFIEVDCISLKSAMQRNKHSHLDVLKLNVEGAEYEILHAAFDAGIFPRILMINYDEVHTQGDAEAPQRLKKLSQRIFDNGYTVAFAELARVTYVRS